MPYRLGMDEKTVRVHRCHGVERMDASLLADFVQLAEKLGIHTPES